MVEKEEIPHQGSPTSGLVTISIGAAATVPLLGQQADVLCLAADEALYRAKGRGRNRVESGTV
jgi:two-component system chemotaxis family response regulator WspR